MGPAVENSVIQIIGIGARSIFSVLIAKDLPNLDAIDTGQCFPRYLYQNAESSVTYHDKKQSLLFANSIKERKTSGLQRRNAITDKGLAHLKAAYLSETITKGNLFYYVYGLLHSKNYRALYARNLCKNCLVSLL